MRAQPRKILSLSTRDRREFPLYTYIHTYNVWRSIPCHSFLFGNFHVGVTLVTDPRRDLRVAAKFNFENKLPSRSISSLAAFSKHRNFCAFFFLSLSSSCFAPGAKSVPPLSARFFFFSLLPPSNCRCANVVCFNYKSKLALLALWARPPGLSNFVDFKVARAIRNWIEKLKFHLRTIGCGYGF